MITDYKLRFKKRTTRKLIVTNIIELSNFINSPNPDRANVMSLLVSNLCFIYFLGVFFFLTHL